MFFKIGVLKNFRKFHRKTPVLEPQTCNFIQKRFQHMCFPVKFAKFLRTSSLQNTSGSCFWTIKKEKLNLVMFWILWGKIKPHEKYQPDWSTVTFWKITILQLPNTSFWRYFPNDHTNTNTLDPVIEYIISTKTLNLLITLFVFHWHNTR